MNLDTLLPFLVAALAIELTPGPNMFYITLLSARHGRQAGFSAIAGVALGLFTIGMLSLFGFAALVADSPIAYETIRWAGVLYLLWLAYESWRDARTDVTENGPTPNNSGYFARGLITNLLNPKAFFFYLTVLPSFALSEHAYRPQAISLTLAYVAVATLVHFAIVLGAGSLEAVLRQSRWRSRLGYIFSALLVLVAVWVAMNTAR